LNTHLKFNPIILHFLIAVSGATGWGQVRSGSTVDLFFERLDSGGAPRMESANVRIEDGSVGFVTAGLADLTVLFTPPVPGEDTLFRPIGVSVKVETAQLLTNDVPGNAGGPLSFLGTLAPISGMAQVGQAAEQVFYAPLPGFNNDDTFFYLMTDVGGSLAIGTVQVVVLTDSQIAPNAATVEAIGGGQLRITFRGIPMFTYTVQFATQLVPAPNWVDIGPATADGVGFYETIHTPPGGTVFYRSIFE
jgi:hypothetical protein